MQSTKGSCHRYMNECNNVTTFYSTPKYNLNKLVSTRVSLSKMNELSKEKKIKTNSTCLLEFRNFRKLINPPKKQMTESNLPLYNSNKPGSSFDTINAKYNANSTRNNPIKLCANPSSATGTSKGNHDVISTNPLYI